MASFKTVAILFCFFLSSFAEKELNSEEYGEFLYNIIDSEHAENVTDIKENVDKENILTIDEHNIFDCPNPRKAKTVLYDEPISVEKRWFSIQIRTVRFPDSIINEKKITCINVRDLDANGRGGYPVIIDGGVGTYHVTINFYTQSGKPMHFRVQIYAE